MPLFKGSILYASLSVRWSHHQARMDYRYRSSSRALRLRKKVVRVKQKLRVKCKLFKVETSYVQHNRFRWVSGSPNTLFTITKTFRGTPGPIR